jgi:hypothetical protein
MTDPCSKEVPVIEVDVSIGGHGCAGFWIECFSRARCPRR